MLRAVIFVLISIFSYDIGQFLLRIESIILVWYVHVINDELLWLIIDGLFIKL